MRKKFPYQRTYKNTKVVKPKSSFQMLSFFDKKVYLDDTEIRGVNELQLKKSSTSLAELNLKMTVFIAGLDFVE